MRFTYEQRDILAGVLAVAVAGVVATEAKDWVESAQPVWTHGWRWVLASLAILVLVTIVAFWILRRLLPLVGMVLLVVFAPGRISERLSKLMSYPEPAVQTESIIDMVARKVLEKLLKPAFPGFIATFERLRSASIGQQHSPVQQTIHNMTIRWLSPTPFAAPASAEVRFVDPIYGTIGFDREFNWLLTHPLLQRLNEIRQLAFAFPRFPGGTHTRFNHSIGVAYLARAAMKRLLDAGVLYIEGGKAPIELDTAQRDHLVKLATVCGLVHDIGHPPLGHTLDRFFRTRYFEGEATSDADKGFLPRVLRFLEEPLAALDLRVDEVLQVLAGTDLSGWNVLVSELINSRLDVDRIDYLQRDAHFTGQREGLLNVDALLSAMRPFQSGDKVFLVFDESYLADVEQFVYARDVMYLRCYEHPNKVVSEALALRFVKRVFDDNPSLASNLASFALLTDAQLVELASAFLPGGNRELSEGVEEVFRSGALSYEEVDSAPFVETLVDGWLEGLLADFTLESRSLLDKIAETESRIARLAGIDPRDVVLVLPDPKANEERSAGLDIKILTRTNDGYRGVPLLNEKDDSSPSQVLRRRKYVPQEVVDSATDLEQVRAAAAKGVSLLGIIRSARFRLRVFLHRRSWEAVERVRSAFRAQGVRTSG